MVDCIVELGVAGIVVVDNFEGVVGCIAVESLAEVDW